MSEYYTFIYCMLHDDGFIITGKHPYVPDGYFIQHSDKCESCDWCNMGVIQYTGSTFEIIERVRIEYDRYYGGGFMFGMYENTLTDEKGVNIENEVLDKWIRDTYEEKKGITFME